MYSDEKKLIQGLKKSDDKAFDYLLDIYGDDILKFCYMKTSDVNIAEDLTQEIFIKIFKYIGKFKGDSSLKTWIYKISLNICREYYRKNKKVTYFDEQVTKESDIEDEFDLEEEILELIDNAVIASALAKIKIDYRDIIYMFYYKDFTIKDIAKILDENENTIKTKLRRGRTALEVALREAGIYG
ncbi:MAG: RNA polymerase sigma factor [Sarcina sp.]